MLSFEAAKQREKNDVWIFGNDGLGLLETAQYLCYFSGIKRIWMEKGVIEVGLDYVLFLGGRGEVVRSFVEQ